MQKKEASSPPMISVEKALHTILQCQQDFGTETISFEHSPGRVLKEALFADSDFPPFNRVCMDGIALQLAAFDSGLRNFAIEGVQAAGSPQKTLVNNKNCLEVMTGAVLPRHTDIVIPYEQLEIKNGVAQVKVNQVRFYQNIHEKGSDKKQGDLLISTNKQITAAEIGVMATVGKAHVRVAKQPKVIVISTGDELVEVSEIPLEHQIRKSNVHSLVSLLKEKHISADTAHLPDDKDRLKSNIDHFLSSYDVLVFSGAVSKGKFDFLPEVLEELGVKKLFHKVKQRPGKPFWFGQLNSLREDKTPKKATIFAFPGNPISTYVNCLKYFYPWIRKSTGLNLQCETAELGAEIQFQPPMTYFLQVTLTSQNGKCIAMPLPGNGSGDLANLVMADAFIELPADRNTFQKGEVYPVLRYRSF
jgi:molybdopterin molybdotransferase